MSSSAAESVDRALYSLNFCAVRANDHLREWFVPMFHWYCKLTIRLSSGQIYPFATLVDYGLLLVEPKAGFRSLPEPLRGVSGRFDQYQAFLQKLHDQPLMQRARRIWKNACQADRAGARDEVGQLLLGALLEQVSSGCPPAACFQDVQRGGTWSDEQQRHLEECPRCHHADAARRDAASRWTGLPEALPPPASAKVALLLSGTLAVSGGSGPGPAASGTNAAQTLKIPPFDPSRPYPSFWFPHGAETAAIPSLMELFKADVACHKPNAQDQIDAWIDDHIDDWVVEACLAARHERASEHKPPKLDDRVLEARAKSRLPGSIAGVTRVESKTELDPWQRIVPSEWMPYVWDREFGLKSVLLGKPLIYKLEREQDQVPKHRALVCFLLESADADHDRQADAGGSGTSLPYVLARRQAFDLIRDLRVSVELLRNRANVEIDVAMFVLASYEADAKLHRLFRLDRVALPASQDDGLNRFDQLMSVDAAAPGFFNKSSLQEEAPVSALNSGSREIIDPQLERFLQRQPVREAAYHGQYLVSIGSRERLLDIIPVTIPEPPIAANVHRGVLLLAVDSSASGAPQWSSRLTRGLRGAAYLLAEALQPTDPDEIRQTFLQLVLGAREERREQRFAVPVDEMRRERDGQL